MRKEGGKVERLKKTDFLDEERSKNRDSVCPYAIDPFFPPSP